LGLSQSTPLYLTVVGGPVGGRVPAKVQHGVQGVGLHGGRHQVAQQLAVAAARRLVQRGPALGVPAQSRGPVLQQGPHTALAAQDRLRRPQNKRGMWRMKGLWSWLEMLMLLLTFLPLVTIRESALIPAIMQAT